MFYKFYKEVVMLPIIKKALLQQDLRTLLNEAQAAGFSAEDLGVNLTQHNATEQTKSAKTVAVNIRTTSMQSTNWRAAASTKHTSLNVFVEEAVDLYVDLFQHYKEAAEQAQQPLPDYLRQIAGCGRR